MYVADHTWPDVAEYDRDIAVVPMGSTEQHGPHLPEGTDHLIAEALAAAAAERTGAFRTPTIDIGVSPHHRQFPGTLWVSGAAFRAYVESLTRNLTYHGIRKVVYVNAHGGNVSHLREVGRTLRDEEVAYAVEWMWDESVPDLVDELFAHNGPHGGPKETAMIWHLHPELVDEDRVADARDGGLVETGHDTGRTHGARTFYDSIDNTDNGVTGDQTDASPEAGERLFEAATGELVALIEWLEDQAFADLLPADRVTEYRE